MKQWRGLPSLYLHIVVVTLFIIFLSGFLAFIATNVYYQVSLKESNDAKNTEIAKHIAALYETSQPANEQAFFSNIADMGFKLYITDGEGRGHFYGAPFRDTSISEKFVNRVLNGQVYHGMLHYPAKTFITGFFANEVRNTIGVPIQIHGETHALFMRPNLSTLFGEIRHLLAFLIVTTIILSIVLIVISTRYTVRPVVELTQASEKIAAGQYDIALNVHRRDEIGKLARSFTVMSSSLRRIEDMRKEFVANVSHEIQSPLTSIKGYAHQLLTKSLDQQEQQQYLRIIEDESSRLSRLSRQLLTLAFLDKDSDVLDVQSYDVGRQLRDVVRQTEWLWQEKDIMIDLQADDILYQGDDKLLYQVWENFLTNSIKYTPTGGMITIKLATEEQGIVVKITDDGIGISEEHMAKLFDRFYKVDESHGEDRQSSGLGLSIAQKIVRLHNGNIHVDSEPDEGTTFAIHLP